MFNNLLEKIITVAMQEKLIARINLKREERLSPDLLGLEVQISVKDSKGSPVQNTTFNLQLDGQDVVKGITDQDGNFEGEKVVNLKESVRKEIELKLAGTGETLARLLLSQKEIRAERERIEEEKKRIEAEKKQEEARLEKERQEAAQRKEEEKRREAEESKRIAGEQEKIRRDIIKCYEERVKEKIEEIDKSPRARQLKEHLVKQKDTDEVEARWEKILASLAQRNPLNQASYLDAFGSVSPVLVELCPALRPKQDSYYLYLMELRYDELQIYSDSIAVGMDYNATRSAFTTKGMRLSSTEEAKRILEYSPHKEKFRWFGDNEVYIDSLRAWTESGVNPSRVETVKVKTADSRSPNCTCSRSLDTLYETISASTTSRVQGLGVLKIPLVDPKDIFLHCIKASYDEAQSLRKPNWPQIHSYFAQINPANGKSYAETLEMFDLNEKGRVEMWIEDGIIKVATSREDQKKVLCVPMW